MFTSLFHKYAHMERVSPDLCQDGFKLNWMKEIFRVQVFYFNVVLSKDKIAQ